MYLNLLTFLGLKNPVLNFSNFLNSRAQLSHKKHVADIKSDDYVLNKRPEI